jgi:hypothetical protein
MRTHPGTTARRHWLRVSLLAAIALSGTGCARAMVVESDRSALAAIEVRNESGVAMIVSYETGGPRATLGSVPAGGTERFIITLPVGSAIRIHGVSESGGRASGPHPVTLQAGVTQRVTLR